MSDKPAKNEDVEIWRKVKDDYYSPSIHVTKEGAIGINVGGLVIVRPVEEWHKPFSVYPEGPTCRDDLAQVIKERDELRKRLRLATKEIYRLRDLIGSGIQKFHREMGNGPVTDDSALFLAPDKKALKGGGEDPPQHELQPGEYTID